MKDAANSETPGTVKISKEYMGLSNNIQIHKKSYCNNLMHLVYFNQCNFGSYVKTSVNVAYKVLFNNIRQSDLHCSGHRSGEARSSFSKLSREDSKSSPIKTIILFITTLVQRKKKKQ